MSAIPGAENKGEIAYSQAITKLADLKQETLKENISVQELQKIKEKILQVIQEAKDANSQQQTANDIVTGLPFEELPPAVKAYYQSKGVTATTTALESYLFNDANLPQGFTIPNSITSIEAGVFFGTTFPKGFTIPSSVTSIGNSAFSNITFQTGFRLPDSITSIKDNAFSGATLPDGFALSNSITSIEAGVFFGTTLPVGFVIPSSITSFGEYAFFNAKIPNGTPIQAPPLPNGNDLTLNSDGTWSS